MQVHGMYIRNKHDIIGYEQTGCVMSMTANRLSFFYSFRGPSKTCEPLSSCLAQSQSHAPSTALLATLAGLSLASCTVACIHHSLRACARSRPLKCAHIARRRHGLLLCGPLPA